MLETGYGYQPGDQIVAPGVTYRVEATLGKGGVGCTYRAINKHLNHPCVIKVMLPAAARDALARERFLREAQMAAQIGRHPNLVTVIHVGHIPASGSGPDTPFFVMDWERGITVRQLARRAEEERRGALPFGIALQIAIDVLTGLAVMHERGVLHRDIKPENVLVTKAGEGPVIAKIIDLGAACLLEDPGQPEYILTPSYAAPEQFAPGRLGPAVDVFATAVMLFEMLTGTHPYLEPSMTLAEIRRRLQAPPPLLSEQGDYPDDLTRALLDAMALRGEIRASVPQFLHALQDAGNRYVQRPEAYNVVTEPDLLPPPSDRPPHITRADLAAPTEPGAPPEMDELLDTGPLAVRRRETDQTSALGPNFALQIAALHVQQSPRSALHEQPTATILPEPVRPRKRGMMDDTMAIPFVRLLAVQQHHAPAAQATRVGQPAQARTLPLQQRLRRGRLASLAFRTDSLWPHALLGLVIALSLVGVMALVWGRRP